MYLPAGAPVSADAGHGGSPSPVEEETYHTTRWVRTGLSLGGREWDLGWRFDQNFKLANDSCNWSNDLRRLFVERKEEGVAALGEGLEGRARLVLLLPLP